MAMQEVISSSLQLVFQTGYDEVSVEPTLVRKNFNNVKADATPAQLYNIATAFESLQQHEMYEINRRDTSEILQQD